MECFQTAKDSSMESCCVIVVVYVSGPPAMTTAESKASHATDKPYRAFVDRRGYLIMSLSRIGLTTWPTWSLQLSEINNIMYAVKTLYMFALNLFHQCFIYTSLSQSVVTNWNPYNVDSRQPQIHLLRNASHINQNLFSFLAQSAPICVYRPGSAGTQTS